MKDRLIGNLREERHHVKDCGGHNVDPAGAFDVVDLVAQSILAGEADAGIVVSSSGAVASLLANKIPGVRACHCQDTYSARQARRTAAAQVLCLGAPVLGDELAADVALAFVTTAVSDDERHQAIRGRIERLEAEFDERRPPMPPVPAGD
jgi:ribose 5-phosphate isomerase B